MQKWPAVLTMWFLSMGIFPSICEGAEDLPVPFWRKKIIFLFSGDIVFLLTDDFTVWLCMSYPDLGLQIWDQGVITLLFSKNVPCCWWWWNQSLPSPVNFLGFLLARLSFTRNWTVNILKLIMVAVIWEALAHTVLLPMAVWRRNMRRWQHEAQGRRGRKKLLVSLCKVIVAVPVSCTKEGWIYSGAWPFCQLCFTVWFGDFFICNYDKIL